ncbi:type I-E CRISPR-associated protein Cas5/CasD [Saccharopolyspora hordei]|uniref:CRISPR system Cascade subunit CasD n=1 Tax=Saccharopolyspora hordei TaxID=1838 RepID=A0A853ANX9_9PSEU|nr:type I-E CRISPR-associated protein Cas5/CasD [Saccharopolyspora hordei]NYI84073.1 CRISPR system Cascade subunit CasD [Saccharopolyspora hordei]
MASSEEAVLLLRLAGPIQSWGDRSSFNRRDTRPEPTKSGVIGLLAAASGRAREDSITDLAELRLGIRVDQPGTLLRDYHTASDYRGRPLPQAGVSKKGVQKPTSPPKDTYVTTRFYLQDAVFLAGVAGPRPLLETLDHAVRHPSFPLALGRRSCVPTQPISRGLRDGSLGDVLAAEPWLASEHARAVHEREHRTTLGSWISLSATLEDPEHGDDILNDVPRSFDPHHRAFASRRIRHTWLKVPTGLADAGNAADTTADAGHDPFALLGW